MNVISPIFIRGLSITDWLRKNTKNMHAAHALAYFPGANQPARQFHGGQHAAMIGHSFAGNLQGRTVIG